MLLKNIQRVLTSFKVERKVFIVIIVLLDIFIYAHGQTQLEEDEGLGQYDYLCISDSTWVHWSTDYATWDFMVLPIFRTTFGHFLIEFQS